MCSLIYGPEFSKASIEIFRETARDMMERNKEKIIEIMQKARKPFIHEGLRVMPMLKGCCKVTFSLFYDEVRFDFILGTLGPLRGVYLETPII